MKHTTWSIEDIALSLFAYMQLNAEFDTFSTERYKLDINTNLVEINTILEKITDFPTQETLFMLIDDLQRYERKSGFIDGVRTGLELKEIK